MNDHPSPVPSIVPDFGRLVGYVAERRRYEAELIDMLDASRAAWAAENASVIERLAAVSKERAEAEAALRTAAIAAYQETGTKKPAPGVGIRVVSKLQYSADDALRWAKEHDIALALDARAFEKVAKASPPEFVTVVETATATIATDLGAAAAS